MYVLYSGRASIVSYDFGTRKEKPLTPGGYLGARRLLVGSSWDITLVSLTATTWLALDLAAGILKDETRDLIFNFPPLPPVMTRILEDGGLIEHINKNGDFSLG